MTEFELRVQNEELSEKLNEISKENEQNKNILREKSSLFLQQLKKVWWEYKEAMHDFGCVDDYTEKCIHALNVMEETAKIVFGLDEQKLEPIKDIWYKEWRKKNDY